jgi:hypothetical protein
MSHQLYCYLFLLVPRIFSTAVCVSVPKHKTSNFWGLVLHVRGFIQKFPDRVDNEINNNNKHSQRSNTKGYGDKTHYTDSQNTIQLHLAAESCTICSSCSRRPVRKLLDIHTFIPSYASVLLELGEDMVQLYLCFTKCRVMKTYGWLEV